MQQQLHRQVTQLGTITITSNYCSPPCSAVYSNKTTQQHCSKYK